MTKKSLDGSIYMVMSSDSPRISRCFLLPLALELNYLPCKCLCQVTSYLQCSAELKWLLQETILTCSSLMILFVAHCSTTFIFLLALVGVFYPYNRGALFTALVVIYALTSGIAGYIATSFYCQLEGTNWVCTLPYDRECQI